MKKSVEIKDKDKIIGAALRTLGYKVDEFTVEIFLNVVDNIRNGEKDKITIMDVLEIKEMVKGLFKD